MPEKGKELRIPHGFNFDDIAGVNVVIVNGTKANPILRSQVCLLNKI